MYLFLILQVTLSKNGETGTILARDCINSFGCSVIESDIALLEALVAESTPEGYGVLNYNFRCCDADNCNVL